MRSLIVLAVALAACAPGAVTGPSTTASATPTVVPQAYLEIALAGDSARISPDGRLVLSFIQGSALTPPSYVLQRVDGSIVWQRPNAMGWPVWLPDSSGAFIPLAAAQRAGPLGILQPDGTLIETALDDADPLLSPDGRWIAAERQEGCCLGITIREIRVSRRSGGAAHTLVTSADPAQQPVSFLGWSASGSVIYRDGAAIRSVTLDGHISDLVTPTSIGGRSVTRSAVSPDGRVILACAADPLAFWVVSGAAIADLPSRPAWPLRVPWCSSAEEVMWVGGHGLPTRDLAGQLAVFDAITRTARPLALPVGATLIGASGEALLVATGGELHVLSGGSDRAVGLRAHDYAVRPIDGGRFFLVSGRTGYLIGYGPSFFFASSYRERTIGAAGWNSPTSRYTVHTSTAPCQSCSS